MAGGSAVRRAEAAYALREQLASAGSASGRQLELVRDRLPSRSGATGNVREALLVESLSYLSMLTPEEDKVAHLRLTGWSPGHYTYQRLVPEHEVERVQLTEGTVPTQVTSDGEELVVERHKRSPPGYCLVEGKSRVMMSFEDIGAALGISCSKAEELWKRARAKFCQAEDARRQFRAEEMVEEAQRQREIEARRRREGEQKRQLMERVCQRETGQAPDDR